jgi:hypothetical protein
MFDEACFPFTSSPPVINDYEFLSNMDPVLSPIRTCLSVGTPTTTAGGLITPSCGLTTPIAEASGPCACPTGGSVTPLSCLTMPPGGLTNHVAEADDATAHPTTLTSTPAPHMTTTTLALPSTPRVAPMTPPSTFVPHMAPTTPPTTSSAAPISPPATQLVPHVLLAGAVPVSPMVHPHLMRTWGVADFWQTKLYITTTLSPILKSVWTALANPHWRAAMEEECVALMSNDTWDLVPLPHSPNVVTGKWIFKYKFKADKTLDWYKARWILCGFTQHLDIDYDETFSPVVKLAMIHIVMSLALSRD